MIIMAITEIEKLIRDYLNYLEIEKNRSPKTRENYEHYLNEFLKFSKILARRKSPTASSANSGSRSPAANQEGHAELLRDCHTEIFSNISRSATSHRSPRKKSNCRKRRRGRSKCSNTATSNGCLPRPKATTSAHLATGRSSKYSSRPACACRNSVRSAAT